MRETNVAGRYARALLLLAQHRTAKEAKPLVPLLERQLEDLRGLAEVVRHGTRVGDFLSHPQVKPQDKQRVLREGLAKRADPSVVVFADLLLRKKRLPLADQIAHEFETLVERAKGVVRAKLVSAVPFKPAEIERLHQELERSTKQHIVLTTEIDPSLVGGAYVRLGDRIVDRSVKTLLERITEQLQEVSV